MLSDLWIKTIQAIGIALIIFVLIVYYQTYVKKIIRAEIEEEKKVALGLCRISPWERVLQIFLVFLTAVYALWVIGVSRLAGENQPTYGIVGVLVIGGLMVFGYYLILMWENKKSFDTKLTYQTPKQRKYFYLKILLQIIILSIIYYYIK